MIFFSLCFAHVRRHIILEAWVFLFYYEVKKINWIKISLWYWYKMLHMRSPNHCILCQFRNYLEISNEFGIVHKFSILISRMDNRTYQLCKDSLHLVKIWELLDILDPSFLFVYAMAICLEIIFCITCIFKIPYFFKCWEKAHLFKGMK